MFKNQKFQVMKKRYILFALLFISGIGNTQISQDTQIRQQLVEWDPVRGAWLSESMQAIATDQPIPDRNFPEEFTPAEMYAKVPADRQEIIRGRVNQNRQNAPQEQRPTWDRMDGFISRPSCNLTLGRTYGDPHITSFDGKRFSFQTVGEFVLARSSDNRFEVQARQKPQNEQISLNTAVAMNVHGDRVAIYASDYPDAITGTPVRVQGQPIFIGGGIYYLSRGGTIENNGNSYTVTWPTGEKVLVRLSRTGRMDFMDISVNVFPCSNRYDGVLGNANGNPNDDFGDRGASMASSTIFDPFGSRDFGRANDNLERQYLSFLANDFARQYRVTHTTSLFDYGFGLSTWNYTDESFPRVHLTLADLSETDRNNARRICEEQGIPREDLNGCIYDVGHANIQPTPRPVINDRTHGRELKPVDGRTPNVNAPSTTGRTPETGNDGTEKTPVESINAEKETITSPGEKESVPISKPVDTKETNQTVPVSKPVSTPVKDDEKEVTKPVSKPTPTPVVKPTPKPVSKPVERPVVKPTTSPKPVNTPDPVKTPSSSPSTPGVRSGRIG